MNKPPRDVGARRLLAIARRIPGYPSTRRGIFTAVALVREWATWIRFVLPGRHPRPSGDPAGVIVSLTSFPDRIAHVWMTVESILRQSRVPDKVVLVLAETQFPGREIPRSLQRQCRRGLEILWTDRDIRSYKKLLPTAAAFPDAAIITVDDDVVYHRSFVAGLIDESMRHPRDVIGCHGRQITTRAGRLEPYDTWPKANPRTPSSHLLLIGVGGVLYPRHGMQLDRLCDYELAAQLCPLGDDLWFWAIARASGLGTRCLGVQSHRHLRRQRSSPALETANRLGGENDLALARVISHFSFEIS